MKKFSELTGIEILNMTEEYINNDFNNVSPFEKKSCSNCNDLTSALNYYCTNDKAIKARRTTIAGCIKCPYWSPDWGNIDDKYKTVDNGYVSIKTSLKRWFSKILNSK